MYPRYVHLPGPFCGDAGCLPSFPGLTLGSASAYGVLALLLSVQLAVLLDIEALREAHVLFTALSSTPLVDGSVLLGDLLVYSSEGKLRLHFLKFFV